jgi:hypothetical protein
MAEAISRGQIAIPSIRSDDDLLALALAWYGSSSHPGVDFV